MRRPTSWILCIWLWLLPALELHRFERSCSFGLLFTAATAPAKDDPLPNSLHNKGLVVFGSALRKQLVNGATGRNALQKFLQLALGIDVHRLRDDLFQVRSRPPVASSPRPINR